MVRNSICRFIFHPPLSHQPIASTSSFLLPPLSRGLASHAYHPSVDSRSPSPSSSVAATSSTPTDLTPEQRISLERMIRVDQAGELGANWIYKGQKLVMEVLGDKATAKQVEEMWETERHHLRTMDSIQHQHRVRPTILYPIWKGAALGLGVVTALMGKKSLMACTEAVETVIGEHYDDQIKAINQMLSTRSTSIDSPINDTATSLPTSLSTSSPIDSSPSSPPAAFSTQPPHPSIPLLLSVLTEFRDDELEHLDTAVENGAQMAPAHALLSTVIETGCRGAIWVAGRI